jgi:DNA-binding CsgD family transcriptional regulator
MERLGSRELENLRIFFEETAVPCDLASFASRVIPAIGRLIPGDLVCHAQIDPVNGHVVTQVVKAGDVDVSVDRDAFERYMMGHPVFVHWATSGDDSPVRTSDFVTRREWHRNDLYQYFYKDLACEDSLPVGLPAPPGLQACFCIERRSNFSERDVQLMNLIRPRLVNAYRNAEVFTLLGQSSEKGGPHSVLLDRFGVPAFVAPATRRLLDTYFGTGAEREFTWPRRLTDWAASQLECLSSGRGTPFVAAPFVVKRGDATLTARLLIGHLTGVQALLVLQEETSKSAALAVRPELGLTRREEELLLAAGRGLSNAGIADELFLSRRTVEKHFENIYSKLGVESRSAALARAFLAAGDQDSP